MTVVDASVLLVALITPAAWSTYLGGAPDLAAPAVLDLEVISGLRAGVRDGRMSTAAATAAATGLHDAPVERVGHRPLLGRIWQLRDNLSAYDAAYVALAEALRAPLLTLDRRMARAPGIRCDVTVLDV